MIQWALAFAFGCVGMGLLLTAWRLIAGPHRADRILALDTMTINAIALITLLGIAEATTMYFEASLLLAMVGFIGTVAFAKFLLRGDIVE